MSILKNAIDSIQIGIEDFQSDDDRRSVSALRNISAGILLLYKEKLCRLSPAHDGELFIKKDIRPINDDNGEIVFQGKGKKTVDVQIIKERFESLKVKVDWAQFDEINSLRNDIEHYFTSESPAAVREVIAKSFFLIRDFAMDELKENPIELIGEKSWSILLDTQSVYEAEEKLCTKSWSNVDWKYKTISDGLAKLRCPSCHSSLVRVADESDEYPEIDLICSTCGENFKFSKIIQRFIDDLLGGEAHLAIKDGGDSPYDMCPACGEDTFIFYEASCVSCGYEREYQYCDMCDATLTLEEQFFDGHCGHCDYIINKDD